MPNMERLKSFVSERFLSFEKSILDAIQREEENRKRALEEQRAKKRKSKKKKKKKGK